MFQLGNANLCMLFYETFGWIKKKHLEISLNWNERQWSDAIGKPKDLLWLKPTTKLFVSWRPSRSVGFPVALGYQKSNILKNKKFLPILCKAIEKSSVCSGCRNRNTSNSVSMIARCYKRINNFKIIINIISWRDWTVKIIEKNNL